MLNAIILGVVQGLTEFLPVSSSGHLVLVQSLLPGFHEPGLLFDLMLHAATLLAVLLYYRTDLINLILAAAGSRHSALFAPDQARMYLAALVIATVPAGILGVTIEDYLETIFSLPVYAGVFLCVTSLILFLGERRALRLTQKIDPFRTRKTGHWLLVGSAQALALLPGISRSGSTISMALALGWKREEAARFSFFLMIPAVGGAVILKLGDLTDHLGAGTVNLLPLLLGMAASFAAGYLAIHLLLRFIRKYSLNAFAAYCLAAGILTVIMSAF